jgi:hypothetical protein
LNNWVGNQLQQGVLYNVRVRSYVDGVFNEWGGACRMMVDDVAALCPATKLMDDPNNQYLSCGVIGLPVSVNTRVHARPVRKRNANCNWVNANRYEFLFEIPAEFVSLTKTSNTGQYWVNTNQLDCGKTYEVTVRASFDNGSTWCTAQGAGEMCLITTANCFQQGGSQSLVMEGTATSLKMYPNPNRGDQLYLSLDAVEEGVNTVSVDIYDGFGKRVSARTIAVNDGFINTVLELNGELATGLYMVNITAGDAVYTQRLVIQK